MLVSRQMFFYYFFVMHAVVTPIMDLQSLLPSAVYPGFLRSLHQWYLDFSGDPFMSRVPLWFASFLGAEALLQMPFFVWAIKRLARGERLGVWGVVYGAHTVTTMIPILAHLIFYYS